VAVVLNPSRQTLLTPVKQIDQTNQRNLSRLPRSESVWGEMGLALWSVKTTPWGPISLGFTPWNAEPIPPGPDKPKKPDKPDQPKKPKKPNKPKKLK
jgi:hypothetical protein